MKYSILKRFCLKVIANSKRKKSYIERNNNNIRTIEEINLKLKEVHKFFLEAERKEEINETFYFKTQIEILKWILKK